MVKYWSICSSVLPIIKQPAGTSAIGMPSNSRITGTHSSLLETPVQAIAGKPAAMQSAAFKDDSSKVVGSSRSFIIVVCGEGDVIAGIGSAVGGIGVRVRVGSGLSELVGGGVVDGSSISVSLTEVGGLT